MPSPRFVLEAVLSKGDFAGVGGLDFSPFCRAGASSGAARSDPNSGCFAGGVEISSAGGDTEGSVGVLSLRFVLEAVLSKGDFAGVGGLGLSPFCKAGVSSGVARSDPNSGCFIGGFDREGFAGGSGGLGEGIRLTIGGGGRTSCVTGAI